jgi:hypothetical protein
MIKFDDFLKAQGLDVMAQAYFASQLNNPDMTLADLKVLLSEDSVQQFLPHMTLGDIWNNQVATKVIARDRPSVADDALAFLKSLSDEYHDGETIAESIGSSTQYVNQLLQKGFKDGSLPIMMRRRGNARGLGTPVYRYVAGMDTEG